MRKIYTYDDRDIEALSQDEMLVALRECINMLLWIDFHRVEEIRRIRQTYGQRDNLPELPPEPPKENKQRYGMRQE